MYIYDNISLNSSQNISHRSCRGSQNTHFMFKNFFSFKLCHFYEIMRKNTVERGRPQIAIWYMHITCWIPTAIPIQIM